MTVFSLQDSEAAGGSVSVDPLTKFFLMTCLLFGMSIFCLSLAW